MRPFLGIGAFVLHDGPYIHEWQTYHRAIGGVLERFQRRASYKGVPIRTADGRETMVFVAA